MNYWILFLVLLNKLLQYCHHVWNARSVLAERDKPGECAQLWA